MPIDRTKAKRCFALICAAEKEVLCNYSKNRLEIGQMAMLGRDGAVECF